MSPHGLPVVHILQQVFLGIYLVGDEEGSVVITPLTGDQFGCDGTAFLLVSDWSFSHPLMLTGDSISVAIILLFEPSLFIRWIKVSCEINTICWLSGDQEGLESELPIGGVKQSTSLPTKFIRQISDDLASIEVNAI